MTRSGRLLCALALAILSPLALCAQAPGISGVRVTPDGPGFVVMWTTDTPMTSTVHNSTGAWLAGDDELVLAHRVVYQCAFAPVCNVTCDESGQCAYSCLGIGPTNCAFPSQLILVASGPAPQTAAVVDDNHGNFYITHPPVLASWREIL